MPAAEIFSVFLRGSEVAFGAIVAGITGHVIAEAHQAGASADFMARWIYTEVVAGLSLLCGICFLVPFSAGFKISWPLDLVLGLAWFASFGVLVNALDDSCLGLVSWDRVFSSDSCTMQRTNAAFVFLSACWWLMSMAVGLAWLKKNKGGEARKHSQSSSV